MGNPVIQVRIPAEDLERAQKAAKQQDQPVSTWVRDLIYAELNLIAAAPLVEVPEPKSASKKKQPATRGGYRGTAPKNQPQRPDGPGENVNSLARIAAGLGLPDEVLTTEGNFHWTEQTPIAPSPRSQTDVLIALPTEPVTEPTPMPVGIAPVHQTVAADPEPPEVPEGRCKCGGKLHPRTRRCFLCNQLG